MSDDTEDRDKDDSKERSRDVATGEYKGLDHEAKEAYRRYRLSYDISEQFCRPYFEKALRYEKLYNNVLPPELDCAFSKVMFPIAFSIVQNEIPRSAASVLSEDEFFTLQAHSPEAELAAENVQHWLYHQARTKNRIFPAILPTLERVSIMGTGYRAVTHQVIKRNYTKREPTGRIAGIPYGFRDTQNTEAELAIVSQNVDFYNILPGPTGAMVNPHDGEVEEGVEWLHWIQYLSRSQVERLLKVRGSNKLQIEAMLTNGAKNKEITAIDLEYKRQAAEASIGNETPSWVTLIRETDAGLENRFRCVWAFYRDEWVLIGENKFVLYAGPPLLDWFPIAKYVDTPNLSDWYGKGLIEITEDVILAFLLNRNFRLDYLTTTLHPTKFVRDDLVALNGGDVNDFDPSPFGMFKFSQRIKDIQKAIWYDRFPEISPQAFMEDTGFAQILQEATGQPNYMKGMGGSGALANETATGIVSLIEEGTARSSMRSLNIEYIGLHDELMLMLKLGKKYEWMNRAVRLPTGRGGWPWTTADAEMIDDVYGIELRGSRALVHKNEMLKRMMSVLPILVNNQNVPGQRELLRQTMQATSGFKDIDKILGPQPDQATATPMSLPALSAQRPTGRQAGLGPGTPTMQNEMESMTGEMGGGMGGGSSRQTQGAGMGGGDFSL